MPIESSDTIVAVSDAALEKITGLRDGEADGEALGLFIEITGTRGVDYTYDLAFQAVADAGDNDVITVVSGLSVVVPSVDVEKLAGAELDLPSNPQQSGLVLRNPNRPSTGSAEGPMELTGEISEQIQQLLDARINPAIAAHGGWAELVEVDGDTVVVKLGGGCQGCAMSKATVTAGIESTIREHIPSIVNVVDVTDHLSGDNPYYAPA
jgi:Fe/S biogenesis protein NfuA